MGNDFSSRKSVGIREFHAMRSKSPETMQLTQSTTPEAVNSPNTNVPSAPKLYPRSRAKSVPPINVLDDFKEEQLPQQQTKISDFTSAGSGQEKMSKHMKKAIKITPNANIVGHIANLFYYHKRLAKGSSCCVLLAQHKKNKKMYALKEMDRISMWNPRLYLTEIKVLKMLRNHPNVMIYFDCYVDDKCLYIASEYCSGGTLLDRIIKMNTFTEEIAAKYITTILNAVHFMHEKNVCHRDLKLNNIVFDKKGFVFISVVILLHVHI